MLKSLLILVALVAAAAVVCPASEVPFTLEKGYIIISGKAKKDVPFEAAVFTGGSYSYFSSDFVKRLRVQVSNLSDATIFGRGVENTFVYAQIPDVVVGDEKPVGVKMRDTQMIDVINKAIGRKIDCILGVDYFDGRIVQFDFKKKVIRFLDKPPFDYGSAKGVSSGEVKLLLKMDENIQTFYGLRLTLPVTDQIELNGHKVRTLFNTAVTYPVSISAGTTKQFSFGPVPDKNTTAKIQLQNISLDGYSMADVPALLLGKGVGFTDVETRWGAIVGLGLMQNFVTTFDWQNKWIVLER